MVLLGILLVVQLMQPGNSARNQGCLAPPFQSGSVHGLLKRFSAVGPIK